MRSIRPNITIVLSLLAVLFALGMAPRRNDLQRRFKDRLPDIQALKADGVVGETWDGYLEPVRGRLDKSERRLLDDENDDRRDLYRMIADEEGTRPEVVAQRNGTRNRRNARPGEYIQDKSGQWQRKGRD